MATELVYRDHLPVAWLPDTPAQAARQAGNLALLNAALVWGEPAPPEANEDPSKRAQECLRLEARVDLLLALVAELMAQHQPAPVPVPVALTRRGIEWQAPVLTPAAAERADPGGPSEVGARGYVALHLVDGIPRPLVLPAEVESLEIDPAGRRVRARFREIPPGVQDALDRLIFRQHRRQVAHARLSRKGE